MLTQDQGEIRMRLQLPVLLPRPNRRLLALPPKQEEPVFIVRQHNAVSTRQGFNEALRLALTLRELGWACAILNMDGVVICE